MVNCICRDKEVPLKFEPQHIEPDQLQHNCFAACVIAQQYSSTSLHFCFHQEKFILSFKKCYLIFFLLLKSVLSSFLIPY